MSEVKLKVKIDGAEETLAKIEALTEAGNELAAAMNAAAEAVTKFHGAMSLMNGFEPPVMHLCGSDNLGEMIGAAMNGGKVDG